MPLMCARNSSARPSFESGRCPRTPRTTAVLSHEAQPKGLLFSLEASLVSALGDFAGVHQIPAPGAAIGSRFGDRCDCLWKPQGAETVLVVSVLQNCSCFLGAEWHQLPPEQADDRRPPPLTPILCSKRSLSILGLESCPWAKQETFRRGRPL